MSFFKDWSIEVFEREYLQIELPNNINLIDKQRVYYLHDNRYLACFIHPKEDRQLFFDCVSMMSLKQYLKIQKISKAKLVEWLIVMIDVFENMNQGVVLDSARFIFLDEESYQLHFCHLPVKMTDYHCESAFQHCLWTILEDINFDGDEAWLSRLYMITRQKSFRFSILKSMLSKKEEKRHFSFFFKRKKAYDEDFFNAFEVREQVAHYSQSEEMKTTMIQEDMKTQILMAGFQYGYLESEGKETYMISANPWIIGRQAICHLLLPYPAVSKQHAKITIEGGRCYLEDLDSTNKTKLNNEILMPNVKKVLTDLDQIEIAGYRFTYHE